MKIVICHNFYQQPGGEDQVFADEARLLSQHGHEVVRFSVHNDEISGQTALTIAGKTLWNAQNYQALSDIVRRERADIVHFHNTFPLLSPAAYYASRSAGAAVVQTLHNYRLVCPGATFYRDGQVCEKCLGQWFAWPAVRHACYRGHRGATAVTAAMLGLHRAMGTWQRQVDAYIALTGFAKQKYVQGGLPARRIIVKPNFVDPDPTPGAGGGGFALFVGRLDAGKGVELLTRAWLDHYPGLPLKVIGDGAMAANVQDAARRVPGKIEWLGRQPLASVYEVVGRAEMLVLPSLWYEGLPKTLVEAFARGTPVVASNIGSLGSAVEHGKTGLHFTPHDPEDLARQVRGLWTDGATRLRMRRDARLEFESQYAAEQNYCALVDIYNFAVARRRRSAGAFRRAA